jgi:hypothetical protein
LCGWAILRVASRQEFLSKLSFNPDPEACIFAHRQSVPIGYTSSPAYLAKLGISAVDK